MNLAIDSNRYTDLVKGDPKTLDILERASTIYVPLIVLGELRAGFACENRSEVNERKLIEFLNTEGVQILSPNESTTLIYADLYKELRRLGKLIPTNDLWIASLCIQFNLVLFARDKHFASIARL